MLWLVPHPWTKNDLWNVNKGKVVSVINTAPCHDGMWGSWGKAPHILQFRTIWTWKASGWVDPRSGQMIWSSENFFPWWESNSSLQQRLCITQVTLYSHKTLAYKCLTKSSLKDPEDDKEYSLHENEVFAVVLLRIYFFWDVVLCHWGSGSWQFEKEYLNLQEANSSRRSRKILLGFHDSEVKTLCSLQMSGTTHTAKHHTSEVQHPQYLISLYISNTELSVTIKTLRNNHKNPEDSWNFQKRGRNANHLTLTCRSCSQKPRSLYAFAYISILCTTSITVKP